MPAYLPLIAVDGERMAHMPGMLLTSALRFTPVGGTIMGHAALHNRWLQLRVRVPGSGIAPDDVPHEYDRLYCAGPARGYGNGSSGRELAIAGAWKRAAAASP